MASISLVPEKDRVKITNGSKEEKFLREVDGKPQVFSTDYHHFKSSQKIVKLKAVITEITKKRRSGSSYVYYFNGLIATGNIFNGGKEESLKISGYYNPTTEHGVFWVTE